MTEVTTTEYETVEKEITRYECNYCGCHQLHENVERFEHPNESVALHVCTEHLADDADYDGEIASVEVSDEHVNVDVEQTVEPIINPSPPVDPAGHKNVWDNIFFSVLGFPIAFAIEPLQSTYSEWTSGYFWGALGALFWNTFLWVTWFGAL